MPSIPPTTSSVSYLRSYPAQSAFNVNLNASLPLPSIQVPEVPISLFLALYQAIINFFVEFPAHAGRFAKERLEGVQAGKIVLLVVVVAAVGLWLALRGPYTHTPTPHRITFVFHVLRWVAGGVLRLVGFTTKGVAAGSVAAGTQSVVYGASTRGIFSVFQSLGTRLG